MQTIIFALLFSLTLFTCAPTQAALNEPTYVPILSDIPLAEGLSLEEGSDTVFDVPDGKIVEVTAFGALDLKEAQNFYKESLAALGWQKVADKDWTFKRGDEHLEMTFEDGENDIQVKFRFTASSADSPQPNK